ncbi:unnamed protein product [Amoebophrya sp. A25]|nr:unnamed protein product [Amoebophrya sp. A25]|eukprot:GSA25T00015676001.1
MCTTVVMMARTSTAVCLLLAAGGAFAQPRFGLDLGAIDAKRPPGQLALYFNTETQLLTVRDSRTIGKMDAEDWATANFEDGLEKTGWAELRVRTSRSGAIPSDLKMYSAGVLEGLLTAPRLSQFYSNALRTIVRSDAIQKALRNVRSVLRDGERLVRQKTNFLPGQDAPEPADPYWKHVRYTYAQLHGVLDGYNAAAGAFGVKALTMLDLFLLNSSGELGELLEAFAPERALKRRHFQAATATLFLQRNKKHYDEQMHNDHDETSPTSSSFLFDGDDHEDHDEKEGFSSSFIVQEEANARIAEARKSRAAHGDPSSIKASEEEDEFQASSRTSTSSSSSAVKDAAADRFWEKKLARTGHCSALVRVTPDNRDLLVGHTTWDDYAKMTRVVKYYDFALPWTQSEVVGMSSYPGCVSSTDEFYLLSRGMVVADTSLEILNSEVYNRIPEGPKLPNFLHVMAANRMARTAAHWAALLTERNNGMKNAQWFVIDYNRFKSRADIRSGVLWMVETIPGLSYKHDHTARLLETGHYSASYNRPVSPEIRQRTGHTAAETAYGPLYSLEMAPRAQLFAAVAGHVETLRDLRLAMRENKYPGEKFVGEGAATWALSPGHAISARLDLDVGLLSPNGGIDAKVTSKCLLDRMEMQLISGPTHVSQPVFKWQDASGADLFPGWPHLGLPTAYDFDWLQVGPAASNDEHTLKDFDEGCSAHV